MSRYRGNGQHRIAHPKIYVWSHTERAEIEYFQCFKNDLKSVQLQPKKELCFTPQQLIEYVIKWKKGNVDKKDGDQVWCIFDVDDFHKNNPDEFMCALNNAHKNGIKIAYINECFELWILLHFELQTAPPGKRKEYAPKIDSHFKSQGLGRFEKNNACFDVLKPYMGQAINNATKLSPFDKYDSIKWEQVVSLEGNPSTNIHLLVEEILKIHS
jgi:hypothetical protein